MTRLVVLWSAEAERDLLTMTPSSAELVIDAVENFAETGRGFLRVLVDGSGEYRLYVDRTYALLELDQEVVRVFRVLPRP